MTVFFPIFKQEIRYIRPQTINQKYEISTRYREKDIPKLIDTLRIVGGDALVQYFRSMCFGQFTDWAPGYKHNMALHHVISRAIESDDEFIWFHMCGQRVCFTVPEFALITGLNFGRSSFDPTDEYDVTNVEAYRAFCDTDRPMTIGNLIGRVTDLNNGVHDDDGLLHLRAALVCVAHSTICGSDRYVEAWMWALVDDLAAFNKFPWGAYSYKVLKHYTEHCGVGHKYHYYGPAWALYVWALEKVPGLGDAVGRAKDDVSARPRIMRWGFRMKSLIGDITHLFEQTEVC